jgi:signal transduction histidine kinase
VAIASVRRANQARFAVGSVALAYALAALAVARGPGVFTTYAGRSQLAAALAVLAGLGLGAAGVVTSIGRTGRRIGDLALIASFVWFAPIWVGWAGGPPLVRSLGMVVAGFTFPVLLHLTLAYPSGKVRSTVVRALVAVVYIEALVSAVGRALFRDPFFVLPCPWDNCTDNVFLVRSLPRLARAIGDLDLWFAAAAGAGLILVCVWRLVRGSGPARRALVPVALPATVLAAATVAHSIALARTSSENPADRVFKSIFLISSGAVTLLAAGLLWAALRSRVQRRSVSRIVAGLGEAPPPGFLESALGQAVGDPGLRIAYWLPEPGRYVDAHGRPMPEPTAVPGRTATPLVREDRTVAVVVHAAAVADLEREIGAAVRLALENERLQAEVLSQLEDLRASRARIVETGDAARRRLERDLHDGAQQRLLALSYDLRLARAGAEADQDSGAASILAGTTAEVQEALRELRELAHGIYPAILTEAGLGPALDALADRAPLPVQIDGLADDRYPAPVETAAYLVVSDAIDDAARRGATRAAVSAVRADGRLLVEVKDDGSDRESSMVHLVDRVGALGGSLAVEPKTIRAEIPCG